MLTSLGLKVESKIESWKTFQFSVFVRKILRLWDSCDGASSITIFC